MVLRQRLSRRSVLGGASGFLAAAWSGNAAAQDLLDPSLLLRRGAADVPTSPLSANSPGPQYARGMAESIVGALVRLVNAFALTSNRLTDLTEREKRLGAEIDAKIKNKEADLEEYRQGLFCSGCGQTRSQILAKGEQFPHSGQTIIKATPDQIARRERELDEGIQRLRDQLRKVGDDKKPLDGDLTRIRKEIFEGGNLWYTAVTYEDALIKQRDVDAAHRYNAQREPITELFKRLSQLEPSIVDEAQRQTAAAELQKANTSLTAIEERRYTATRAYQLAMSGADGSARSDGDRFRSALSSAAATIKESGNRGYLEISQNLLTKNPLLWANGAGRGTGGIFFHMGDYSEASTGGTLPSVSQLIQRAGQPFRNGPPAYFPSAKEEGANILNLATRLQRTTQRPAAAQSGD